MKKSGDSEITVIIPTLNEEEGIGPTIKDIEESFGDPCLLVIDGNSVDKTVEIARKMGAHVVKQVGAGKGRAIAQVLGYISSGTRYVVFIDGDFTYPARHIPEMINILENNPDIGMVIGNRFNDSSSLRVAMHNVNGFGNKIIAMIHQFLGGTRLKDPLTGLRVVRWSALEDWLPRAKEFDIEVELNYYVHKKGYRIAEIPIEYRPRLGEKKLKWRDGFTILKRMVIQRISLLAHN